MIELLRQLNQPAREFTPIPFWFLNNTLTHAELRRQLRDFCDHGVYGVVLHPRIGLPQSLDYLSQDFFQYIHTAVEAASELGMTVILYDEGMYPSGSANGQVVRGHPELASVGLTLQPLGTPLQPGDLLLTDTPQGLLICRKSGGTIRGIHFGEDDGEPNAPPSADILNPAAVQRFIELTHETYYQELKEYFGHTIRGFFTDEPMILGRNQRDKNLHPWTTGFDTDFTAAGGDLRGLTALFYGEENKDTRMYHHMIWEREGKVYYAALSHWCEEHGIVLMGHPHQSDDIEVERYFHIPGQDLVLRWIAPEIGGLAGINSTMAKCSADAARLMGRRRNSNECFGACNKDNNPWQLSGGDIKWYLDWLAVRGVNLFIPHAFYYSIAGKRKDERPPDVGPHSIWWAHYSQWAMYMARLSCLMTDMQLRAETAVLCKNRDLHPDLVAPLFEHQTGFQYLPQSVWKKCREENGMLVYAGRTYMTVLGETDVFPSVPHCALEKMLPDCYCDPPQPSLRTAQFIRAGTTCWFLVNEGESDIDTWLTLPTQLSIGEYDLWTGTARRGTNSFRLKLPLRSSLLLFTCSEEEWSCLPQAEGENILPCPQFIEQSKEQDPTNLFAKIQKEYAASLTITAEQLCRPNAILELEAEEMAELWANETFVGVGFWPPQRFDLKPYLCEGKNTLRLRVTGSPANIYGNKPVWYGLKGAEYKS